MLLGQEDHAHAIFTGRRQRDAQCRHLGTVQGVGQLDQDAGSVPHQLVGTNSAAVIQVLQDLECVLDNVM